ncbi:MAG: hypothetical protein WCC78_03800 [Terriglobales bacterium]
MGVSPHRSWLHRKLYRNERIAVICAVAMLFASALLLAQVSIPQYGRKPADKGPRALGLVQLSPTGKKARFVPIAIMMDGKFYDAGAYKADPVPMALDFGIVYEGFRSGVSQGVFTITQPGQLNHTWIAEGTWLPAGAIDPKKPKKYSPPVVVEDDSGPPVLHRRAGSSDSESSSDKKDEQKPATPAASPPPTTTPGASAPTPANSSDAAKPPAAPEAAKASASPEPAKTSAPVSRSDEPIEDPNRPRLRRGKPESTVHRDVYTAFDEDAAPAAGTTASGKDSATSAPKIVTITIPAISDAGGPDPRPYTFDMKPEEEASYRSKMLDLAAKQLAPPASAATKEGTGRKTSASKSARKATNKAPEPAFDDVSLHIFDLSSSNEPVLVLSAKTHPVAAPADATAPVEEPKEITLIARTNLEGELRKLFFSQTDSRHLDVTPRMELIDAVDADGDGRGELLFRRTFDNGSAYAIYRVTADGLWPLFEPTP